MVKVGVELNSESAEVIARYWYKIELLKIGLVVTTVLFIILLVYFIIRRDINAEG